MLNISINLGPEFLDGRDDSGLNQRATPLKLLFTDKVRRIILKNMSYFGTNVVNKFILDKSCDIWGGPKLCDTNVGLTFRST